MTPERYEELRERAEFIQDGILLDGASYAKDVPDLLEALHASQAALARAEQFASLWKKAATDYRLAARTNGDAIIEWAAMRDAERVTRYQAEQKLARAEQALASQQRLATRFMEALHLRHEVDAHEVFNAPAPPINRCPLCKRVSTAASPERPRCAKQDCVNPPGHEGWHSFTLLSSENQCQSTQRVNRRLWGCERPRGHEGQHSAHDEMFKWGEPLAAATSRGPEAQQQQQQTEVERDGR